MPRKFPKISVWDKKFVEEHNMAKHKSTLSKEERRTSVVHLDILAFGQHLVRKSPNPYATVRNNSHNKHTLDIELTAECRSKSYDTHFDSNTYYLDNPIRDRLSRLVRD